MTKIKKKRLIGRLLHVRRDKDRLDIAKDGLDAIIRCFMASVLTRMFRIKSISYQTYLAQMLNPHRGCYILYPENSRNGRKHGKHIFV